MLIIDYRFRIRPLRSLIEPILEESKEGAPAKVAPPRVEKQKSKNGFKPKTLDEFLFADLNGDMPLQVDLHEVDLFYNEYMKVMFTMYEKLRGKFNLFANKCLSEKQKSEFGIILVDPSLP